jgi:hypothetical protein
MSCFTFVFAIDFLSIYLEPSACVLWRKDTP